MNREWNLTYLPVPCIALAYLALAWQKQQPVELLQGVLLLGLGYVIAMEDFRSKTIPNFQVLLLLGAWVFTFVPQLVLNINTGLVLLSNSALGFAFGGGLFLLVYILSRRGVGGGDVKMMAVVGLYVGLDGILAVILYGSILASLYGLCMILMKKMNKTDTMPLAPFLYVGIVIELLIS